MGRAPCCEKVGLRRGRWTSEEDETLMKYIKQHGEGSWRSLPKNAGLLRCGKSCRLRWINYLRDDLKRGNISEEEEDMILKLHATLGNRWSLIAGHLPGRTDNEIKNYWNTHLSRRVQKSVKSEGDDDVSAAAVDLSKLPGQGRRRGGSKGRKRSSGNDKGRKRKRSTKVKKLAKMDDLHSSSMPMVPSEEQTQASGVTFDGQEEQEEEKGLSDRSDEEMSGLLSPAHSEEQAKASGGGPDCSSGDMECGPAEVKKEEESGPIGLAGAHDESGGLMDWDLDGLDPKMWDNHAAGDMWSWLWHHEDLGIDLKGQERRAGGAQEGPIPDWLLSDTSLL